MRRKEQATSTIDQRTGSRIDHRLHSSVTAAVGGNVVVVEDRPVTEQITRRRRQTVPKHAIRPSQTGRIRTCHRISTHQHSHNTFGAGRHVVHVLDRLEHGRVRQNVGHVQVLNITFLGMLSQSSGAQLLIQTEGTELIIVTLFTRQLPRQHTGGIRRYEPGNAVRTLLHRRRPHIARRHQHSEVQNVVRVGSATEAHLDSLAIRLIRIDNTQQRGVAVGRAEVGREHDVTHAAILDRRDSSRISDASASNSGIRATRCNITDDDGMGRTGKAETGDHCSGAERHEAFLHSYDSINENECKTQALISWKCPRILTRPRTTATQFATSLAGYWFFTTHS